METCNKKAIKRQSKKESESHKLIHRENNKYDTHTNKLEGRTNTKKTTDEKNDKRNFKMRIK